MDRRTVKLIVASALIVAVFLAIFARKPVPDAVALTSYGVTAVALVSLGFFGRGRALPVFAATYALGCVLWQWLWWTDTPQLTGIDDIPPLGGFIVTVPFALVLVAAGWVTRGFAGWASTSTARLRAIRR